MPFHHHDDLEFHYLDRGSGVPVVFQHGLGGETERIFAMLQLPSGFRLLGLDCRAHGKTKPLGSDEKLRFDILGDDVISLLDRLEIKRAVLGGTSMGAGVALNCAIRHPKRVLGIMLLRPAWLEVPNQTNLELFSLIARLLRQHGPDEGSKLFQETKVFRQVSQESSDSAGSLLSLFSDLRAQETVARLERIPQDSPNRDRKEWQRLRMPCIVLATERDPVHPFEFGAVLAKEIPGAELRALTPKCVDLARYTAELNHAVSGFLHSHFLC